jgi:uncharacterized protein (DUF885 family)
MAGLYGPSRKKGLFLGFHAEDPRYRLAQIQDALLRDARFIAGIRMHTGGMTVAQAEEFFVKEGYQPRPSRGPKANAAPLIRRTATTRWGS